VPAVRDLVLAVTRSEQAAVEASLVRAIRSPQRVIALLELVARLNRELGPHGDHGPAPVRVSPATPAAPVRFRTRRGHWPARSFGADSIVLSGVYEDDIDLGDEIIHTGHGGKDPGPPV
jgi:hypothetical protein